jgi:hypothetical protein
MVTDVDVLTAAHPPDVGVVYVTVYVPGVLVLGRTDPLALIVNPEGDEEKVPLVYAPVPVNVTDCCVLTEAQNGFPG